MPSLEDDPYDPRVAALLGVHLVGQVLDEAFVIASAAVESGDPWRYLTMLKNLRSDTTIGEAGDEADDEAEDDTSFVDKKKVGECLDERVEHMNVVTTSTPTKGDTSPTQKPDSSFIGQGDEEFETTQADLSKSTSMFINHLFDMSEVESVVICEDTQILESNPIPHNLLTQAMEKIMESYVNAAFNIAFAQEPSVREDVETEKTTVNTEQSCYSFLAHALGTGIVSQDVSFYIDDGIVENVGDADTGIPRITELIDELKDEPSDINDMAQYENAYLTLNRDYEQCSDDDGDPVLQDPKGMNLQEVELMTASTSEDNLSTIHEPVQEEVKQLAATSAVTATSGSRKSKSSLISRCRSQGARFLACLRGWWRRKSPGKRKDCRHHGSMLGVCPLSPEARRRASSLLDQRHLYSPSPSRSGVWKFNTVNEALVKSSRWKEYTFDVKPDECGEY